jgi:hypothetical protein
MCKIKMYEHGLYLQLQKNGVVRNAYKGYGRGYMWIEGYN